MPGASDATNSDHGEASRSLVLALIPLGPGAPPPTSRRCAIVAAHASALARLSIPAYLRICKQLWL